MNVLIASYLEPEHADRVTRVDSRLRVVYQPELLPKPRYPADHNGHPLKRSASDENRWRQLLQTADVLFDFDTTHREDLPELAPNLRWIQATSAGIGQFVKRMGYDVRMPSTVFTTASGVHAKPLAEFCLMGMLVFSRGFLRIVRDQERKHWERFAGTDLDGRTLGIIGVGKIGSEVARVARSHGMKVLGTKRRLEGADPTLLHLDELHSPQNLDALLKRSEFLVLTAPHTPETERILGREELSTLPKGAVVINIGRGALIEEAALVDALTTGHLGGACLDVFEEEPLPRESPLWEMPNVIVSPHSGSTSDRENRRLTDLFCENLEHFLAGKPLVNVLDTARLY